MTDLAFLDERRAQAVYLVRAFEQADGDERWLEGSERRRATEEALEEGPKPSTPQAAAKVAAARAERLVPELDAQAPMLSGVRRVTRLGAGLGLPVMAVAAVVGLSTSALGPARHVNLLSAPLLLALGWNLLMYVGFLLVWLLRGRKSAPGQGFARLLAPLFTLGYLRRAVGQLRRESQEKASVVARAVSYYLNAWRGASRPLVESRARRLMHLAAMVLALGMMVGMYGRGLIYEYRATWESTFLDAQQAHRLLDTLLGPAGRLLSIPVPGLEEVASMRAPGDGDAAPWIHLYAATTLMVIVLPRGLLVLIEALRAGRLRRRVPVEISGAYFRRVLALGRGEHQRVEVVPYSVEAPARVLEVLQTALLDLFGSRSTVHRHPAVEYGGDVPAGAGVGLSEDAEGASLDAACAVLFNLAQTPEAEVHGRFVEQARRRLAGRGPVLAVVDQSRYRSKLEGTADAEERLKLRRRAWDRVLDDARARTAHVDLVQMTADEVHRELHRALDSES
ncbi:MAG: DUF2868 domain-containing protein [Acidobacteriota bacterium]|nr:DUF2868 domain-containing protein [Acidobacteriota bacterium]